MAIAETTNKVPTGYKQTEVGIIPTDWELKRLEDICIKKGLVRGPFGGALKKEYFVNKGIKVYEQKNAIYRSIELGDYYIDSSKYLELKRFEVRPGDFIISCSGTIGKIYLIPRNAPKGIINQALLKITTDDSIISKKYFLYYFDWDKFQERIIDNTQGGAMKNLVGMSIFRETLILVPASHKEQKAIASALSEIDALIAKLESLIEKKKNIKQGAMQELLIGKRRLPGFSGEWEKKSLGDHDGVELFKGQGLAKSGLHPDGKYECIHYGELFTKYKECIEHVISQTNRQQGVLSRKNDVLMPTSDVTPNGLATASCILKNNIRLGGDILIIRLDIKRINGTFFAYQINVNREQIMSLVTGTTVYHLYPSNMKGYTFLIPPIEEQDAIANVLLDMDKEIGRLESLLKKYQNIKQGMKQKLLTGKIRLVK